MLRLAVNGVPRSGTTLVGQVLRGTLDLMGVDYTLQRTHPACDNHEEVDHSVVTVRHPYDIAASRYRVRLSRDPSTGGLVGLEAEIAEMHKHFHAIKTPVDLYYEEFYSEYTPIFVWLEHKVGMIPSNVVAKVSKQCSLEANRKRAAMLADFNHHDDTGIHGDHIGAVKPGSWRDVIPVEWHDYVVSSCQQLAKDFGYE